MLWIPVEGLCQLPWAERQEDGFSDWLAEKPGNTKSLVFFENIMHIVNA